MRLGVLALARPTFDVPYAEELAAKAFAQLDHSGITTVGPRTLLFDADSARLAAAALATEKLDGLLLLQVTFTDASMTLELARGIAAPLALWAFPEPRTGGRLRLNAFCGLNLAAHALGRAGISYRYLYQSPEPAVKMMPVALWHSNKAVAASSKITPSAHDYSAADAVLEALKNRRIGLIGEHPAGFETCRFDGAALNTLTGIKVEPIALSTLFERSSSVTNEATLERRKEVETLKGIDGVDQAQLNRSLTLFEGLKSLKTEKDLSAFAVRCWPEMFTEYGCAICGPMGMMNSASVPAACEADVYGAVTALMLQEIAGKPSWLVDVVDMDKTDGTAVFWHCGSAPSSMRDPDYAAEAQIHSNRKMPLLYQFPLKPGRITIARLSQANNNPHLLVTSGEVVQAPLSFTGTSAVVRLDTPVGEAMQGLIGGGYEHHVAMVYGDHVSAMTALGEKLGIPVCGLAD